jgi:hypothetical protein
MSAASARQLTLPEFQPKRKRQSYSSVEAYLECQVERRRVEQIFDGREVRKIARICRLHPEDVRAGLKRCGYVKTTSMNGLVKWVRKDQESRP